MAKRPERENENENERVKENVKMGGRKYVVGFPLPPEGFGREADQS